MATCSCFHLLQDTVSIVLFNVIPQMIDVVVACMYLAARMQLWVACIVMVTVSSYIPLTIIITERRGKVRWSRLHLCPTVWHIFQSDDLLGRCIHGVPSFL